MRRLGAIMKPMVRVCGTLLLGLLLAACDNTTADEHVTRAEAALAGHETRTAVIELKNALQKAPDHAQARLLLGEAQLELGDYPSALKELERALDLGLDDDRVRAGLLRAKLRLGRHQEVIGALEDAGALTPSLAVILADAYLASGDLGRAHALYEQGSALSDGNMGLGVVAWQQGDVERAERHLARAVELDPRNADAWLRKGELELALQRLEAAEASFAKAAELPASRVLGHVGLVRSALLQKNLAVASDRAGRLLEIAPSFPMAHYLDGLVRFEQQDLEGAEAAIREVQRVAPDHPPSLYLMGAIKYRQRHLAQAENNLQRYLAQDPGNESAAKLLASARFDQGSYERAVEVLTPFVAGTRDPQVLAMYGAAQLRLQRPAEATAALERAVDMAPDAAPFRNQLALSLLAAGDRSRAEAELESAIEVDGEQFQSGYLLAMLRMRDRDWEAAGEAVESLIESNPDNPMGYNLRGALALMAEDVAGARRAFATALEKDPQFLPAVQNLARLAEQQGDRAAAMGHYQAFLESSPDNEGALIALADLALRAGDRAAAADHLQRAAAAHSDAVRPRLGLARLHLAEGRVQAASEAVDEALALAPDLPDLLLLRAEIDLRRGDVAAAKAAAVRLQAGVAEAAGAGGGASPTLYLALGSLQARLGDRDLARSNLERALSLSDGNNPAALRALARLDLGSGDADAAAAKVERLLAAGDDAPGTRLLQADVLLAQGQRAEAERMLTELADAGAREAVMRLATLSLADGDAAAAAGRLEEWLGRFPGDLGAELLLADALMRQDQDRALARYERLSDTGNAVVLNNLAWLYMERNDPRAVETARRALAAAPDNPDVLDTVGWVLLKSDVDVSEAVSLLRRSVQLNPRNASVQYHLGVALRESGDLAGAREALRRALDVEGFPEAREARAALAALEGAD